MNFVSFYSVWFASPFQALPQDVWIPSFTMSELGETEPTAGDDFMEEETEDCIKQGDDNRPTAGGIKSDNEEPTAGGVKSDNEQSDTQNKRRKKKKRKKKGPYLGPNGDMAYIDAVYKGDRYSVQPGTVEESEAVYFKFFGNFNSQEREKVKEVEVAMLRMRWYMHYDSVKIRPEMILNVYECYNRAYEYYPIDESIPMLVERMCWLNRACAEEMLKEMESQHDDSSSTSSGSGNWSEN